MRMSELYETDILAWSRHQSDVLRRLAAGERVNDQVDWPNVIEEIESVGTNSSMPSSHCWCRPCARC
jgi:hypothetical protein